VKEGMKLSLLFPSRVLSSLCLDQRKFEEGGEGGNMWGFVLSPMVLFVFLKLVFIIELIIKLQGSLALAVIDATFALSLSLLVLARNESEGAFEALLDGRIADSSSTWIGFLTLRGAAVSLLDGCQVGHQNLSATTFLLLHLRAVHFGAFVDDDGRF